MAGEKAAMTFTDPPYNALKSWNKDEAHSECRLDPSKWFENDNMEWDDFWGFAALFFGAMQGHSVYCCCDYRIYDGLLKACKGAGLKPKHCIVWNKNVWGLGKRYRFKHEFIIYACRTNDAPFYGGRDEADVWDVAVNRTPDHNTPKPIGLPTIAIRHSSRLDEIVFDGFCGSGTTMVACENLGRKCRAIEIAPGYCAVILERMATAFPGIEIELDGHQ